MKNIYSKLMKVRCEFHKLELKKTGHNKFANFKYYELADFLIPATNLLNENGLCPMISFSNEQATMTVVNCDNTEEVVTFTSPMRDLQLKGTNDIQNLGGVQTYLTRYLYIQLLNIVEADVFDATSGKENNKSNSNLDKVYKLAYRKGYSKEKVNEHIKAKGFDINKFDNVAFKTMYEGYSAMGDKQ